MRIQRDVIGLVPAGGKASRISPLPCSKELYPVGFRSVGNNNTLRPKVVSHYLLEKMRIAGITRAYIILREGKWDIPSYYGEGKMLDMHLAYLMMGLPYGVPFTLDQAYPFVKNSVVALGFPDIIFQSDDAFISLLAKLDESSADIVLGLFPAGQPHKTDMVELDEAGRICSIHIRPEKTQLSYSWEIAVWTPVFSRYLHDYVQSCLANKAVSEDLKELYVGDVIHAAIMDGMRIEPVLFRDGNCLDIGTPEDLVKALQTSHSFNINCIQGD